MTSVRVFYFNEYYHGIFKQVAQATPSVALEL